MANYKYHILLCGGTGCTASESPKIKENFINLLAEKNLSNDVQVVTCSYFLTIIRITSNIKNIINYPFFNNPIKSRKNPITNTSYYNSIIIFRIRFWI